MHGGPAGTYNTVMKRKGEKLVCVNRRAKFDYHIEDTYEAGMVLLGSEVKSLRDGKASLGDSYAKIVGGEVYLVNCHVSPYKQAGVHNHEPLRERKLLLNKREIKKLIGRTAERGYTLVPLRIYFSGGRAKVELALAKGKKLHDKREALKRETIKREMERAIREHRR